MLKCPFCDKVLVTESSIGWLCECGEVIPFGFEINTDENCESCPVRNCPKRR